jgi:hypothetical protein
VSAPNLTLPRLPRLRQYEVFLSDERGNLHTSVGMTSGLGIDARAAIEGRFWGDTKITSITKVPAAASNTFLVQFSGSAPGYYRAVLQ